MEATLRVEIISNDTVKPSCPTPPERKTITLSFLDESFPTIHVPWLLIFTNNETIKTTLDNNPIIISLKTSLSETLTHFFPLAGRFENEYTVSCNDQGIPFIITRVECQLKDYLNSPRKLDIGSKLLPPEDIASFGQLPITTVDPLAFQVNIFVCGGVAIGCYSNHKLIDATSLSNFLNYWAALASRRYEDLVEPDFETILKVFPPLPKEKRVETVSDDARVLAPARLLHQHNVSIKVLVKSFKFNNDVINKLKANAVTETVPNPSNFEAVVGFVWMHAMGAILKNNNEDIAPPQPIPTVLSFVTSLRSRTTPPLPKQTMGNIIATITSERVGDGNGSYDDEHRFKEIVREIHATIIQKVKQKVEILQGENGGEVFLSEKKAAFKDSLEDKAHIFSVISWCKLGFQDVDFGFGQLDKIIPVGVNYPFLKNSMILVDYTDSHGVGIEVYVYLEDKHMPFLEGKSQFKCFATVEN